LYHAALTSPPSGEQNTASRKERLSTGKDPDTRRTSAGPQAGLWGAGPSTLADWTGRAGRLTLRPCRCTRHARGWPATRPRLRPSGS